VDSWLLCAEFQHQLSVNYITNVRPNNKEMHQWQL